MITSRNLHIDGDEDRKYTIDHALLRELQRKPAKQTVSIRRRTRPESFGSIRSVIELEAVLDETSEVIRSETHVTNEIHYHSFARVKTSQFIDELIADGYAIGERDLR